MMAVDFGRKICYGRHMGIMTKLHNLTDGRVGAEPLWVRAGISGDWNDSYFRHLDQSDDGRRRAHWVGVDDADAVEMLMAWGCQDINELKTLRDGAAESDTLDTADFEVLHKAVGILIDSGLMESFGSSQFDQSGMLFRPTLVGVWVIYGEWGSRYV